MLRILTSKHVLSLLVEIHEDEEEIANCFNDFFIEKTRKYGIKPLFTLLIINSKMDFNSANDNFFEV